MRPAIAMIELIFALVVMGIVMMSAPMLIATAKESTSVALQQEGINEAASRINMILTYPWDQNDTNDSCIPPVLHVTKGKLALDMVAGTGRRIGVPIQSNSHTFVCAGKEFNASAIAVDGLDDIDDFNDGPAGQTLNLVASGTGGKDYIERTTVSMVTTVQYDQEDNPATPPSYNAQTITYIPSETKETTGTSNVKTITVTLTSTSGVEELQKTIVLKAFSCNIGGYEYEPRTIY